MRIKYITARKVHGYLDINIDFNDDLSIVTGINGSGKTTALKLMHGILCPNFQDLLSIQFEIIFLGYEVGGINSTFRVEGRDESIIITHNNSSEVLKIDRFDVAEFKYNSGKHEYSDINHHVRNKCGENHPIIAIIEKLPSPIFLGLERKRELYSEDVHAYSERELLREKIRYFSVGKKNSGKYHREYQGSLSTSLTETELIIQKQYSRIKNVENRYSNSVRDKFIFSSFEYLDMSSIENLASRVEQKKLLDRRSEIEKVLVSLGYSDNNELKDKVRDFFQRLQDNIRNTDSDDIEEHKKFLWEGLINKTQIDRLVRVLGFIDENKTKLAGYYRPFDNFLSIINDFFKDSKKKIEIDNIGQISVSTGTIDRQTIDALSSGERQIFVIFAAIIFSERTTNRNSILIIDEPEISLHIRWQEKFIDSLYQASNNSQYIIATHSPDIIGDYKNKAVRILND